MARIRTIKPDFWSDGTVSECSVNARLLFIGTWNFADDYGNLDRSAKQLKARVFPADNINCSPLIYELLVHGLLSEYSVNGKIYLHIHGFKKHQRVNRPGPKQFPDYDDSLRVHVTINECSTFDHGALHAEGKGREGNGVNLTPLLKTPNSNPAFDAFWKAYPRKNSKHQALKAFAKINPDEQLLAVIIAAIERAKTREDWQKENGQFIPYPATWLNAGGWKDEGLQLEPVIRRAVI